MAPENNTPFNPQMVMKKKKNANTAYILIGLAVLVVFAAIIIFSIANRNPLNDALLPEPQPGTVNTSVNGVNSVTLNEGVSIDRVDIMTMESFPVQVSALVRGNLADGCMRIANASSRRVDSTFYVDFETVRQGDICTQALVPFERNVPLEVSGLRAGTYTVSVAGFTTTFKMATDNMPISQSDK